MKSFFGYDQNTLIKYKLTANEIILIHWMEYFFLSPKIQTIEINSEKYYHITYQKILSDLNPIFKNIRNVRTTITKISSTTNNDKPLQLHIVHGSNTYFKFSSNFILQLKGKAMIEPMFEITREIKVGDKNYQKIKVNPNALVIWERMKTLTIDGAILFNHKSPTDSNHYTKTFGSFQRTLSLLYSGRFLSSYGEAKLADWFQEHYKFYLRWDEIKEEIVQCKGSWANINNLMYVAGKNYLSWFRPESEVRNKASLPRNINSWIFFPIEGTSMFYVSLLQPSSTLRQYSSELYFKKIGASGVQIFSKIYSENFDSYQFWKKCYQIVKWYRNNSNSLMEADSNFSYWLDPGLDYFLDDYVRWLLSLGKKPFIANIGTGNPTWDFFTSSKAKVHGIKGDIPKT